LSVLQNAIGMSDGEFQKLDGLFAEWLSRNGSDPLRAKAAERRYSFVLVGERQGYAGAKHVKIAINQNGAGQRVIREKLSGTKLEILYQDRPKTASNEFYTDSIKTDRDLAYRGISWEEWYWIEEHGYIQSAGYYNIGQKSLTLWADDFATAAYYSSGFAPWPFKPGVDYPSFVLAIPKELTIGPKDHKEVPEGERATVGPLDTGALKMIWQVLPIEVEGGFIEGSIERRHPPRFEDMYMTGPSTDVVIIPFMDYR
jgi:hypothetical protein